MSEVTSNSITLKCPSERRGKTLAGLKADTIIFDNAQFAPPYYLNGMSYRLISYNMDDQALLSFVGKSDYRSDVYSTLESYYQRIGDVYAARDVHVAGKDRERDIAFSKSPLRSLWMWVQYATMGYGKFLVRALLWSLVFIIVGCVIFWREDGMETQDSDDAEKYSGRYHPIWYSLATFLPIFNRRFNLDTQSRTQVRPVLSALTHNFRLLTHTHRSGRLDRTNQVTARRSSKELRI
jgi:hypothetical protein